MPSSKTAGSHFGAPASDTLFGPPDRMMPAGCFARSALERRVERNDLGVDRQLAQATRDELGVLRAEIENENGLMRHGHVRRESLLYVVVVATRPRYCGVLLVAALWLTAGHARPVRRPRPLRRRETQAARPAFCGALPARRGLDGHAARRRRPPRPRATRCACTCRSPRMRSSRSTGSTASTLWSVPLSASAAPLPADGALYVATGEDLHALDAATGATRWTTSRRAQPAHPRALRVSHHRVGQRPRAGLRRGVRPHGVDAAFPDAGDPRWCRHCRRRPVRGLRHRTRHAAGARRRPCRVDADDHRPAEPAARGQGLRLRRVHRQALLRARRQERQAALDVADRGRRHRRRRRRRRQSRVLHVARRRRPRRQSRQRSPALEARRRARGRPWGPSPSTAACSSPACPPHCRRSSRSRAPRSGPSTCPARSHGTPLVSDVAGAAHGGDGGRPEGRPRFGLRALTLQFNEAAPQPLAALPGQALARERLPAPAVTAPSGTGR